MPLTVAAAIQAILPVVVAEVFGLFAVQSKSSGDHSSRHSRIG